MKAFYDEKPQAFHEVGNGSFLYRYDIEEYLTDEEEPRSQWRCKEVTIWGNLTREKVVTAVIESKWSNNDENKIINDYIASTKNFFSPKENEIYEASYNLFLEQRKELKLKVNSDWEIYNE